MQLSSVLITLNVLSAVSLVVKSPPEKKTESLVERQHQTQGGTKLNPYLAKKQWAEKKHDMHVHMLARNEPPRREAKNDRKREAKEDRKDEAEEDRPVFRPQSAPAPATACIACYGVQVVYGKYRSYDGDQIDNSYFLFRDPVIKDSTQYAPVVIHFHAGGFFSGKPWRTENAEITAYLNRGFAFVSVGYRLATQKYFYEDVADKNMTEELIHVDKDGNLTLDTTGKTMEDYEVRVGKQEFITKYLYDATQMIEHLILNADKFNLDMTRIVFAGESVGGAAMQYLTWVYHAWNVDRYTPRGIIYHNAQLNYPVNNMLSETWDIFAETMGPQVKLADVVSEEACPTIVGNHMCGSALGNVSDYNLCNDEWNERSLREFCGEALKSATLGQARARQVWPREDDEVGKGMEKLWYTSLNMQKHLPHDPFYIYVANSMNGTGALDVSHHSVYALNFAKYAEMGDHGGHQYTIYYTDFAHMTEADRGMQRYEVLQTPPDLEFPESAVPQFSEAPSAAAPPSLMLPGAPGPAPAGAPAPGPAFEVATPAVFNYLSTHGWREDVAEAREIEAASMEERVLYACLSVGIGPFREIANTTTPEPESGAPHSSMLGFGIALLSLIALLSRSE